MDLGIKPLDRVLVQLPNWTEFVPVYFACQKIGAITVMLIDRYRQHEIERLAEIAGATAWIVPVRYGKTDFLPIVEDVRAASARPSRMSSRVRGEVDAAGLCRAIERLIAETEPTERGSGPAGGAQPGPEAGGPHGSHRRDDRGAEDRAPHPQQPGLHRRVLLEILGPALRGRQPDRGLHRPRSVLHQGLPRAA